MPFQAASISHSPPDRKVLGFLAITQGLVLRGQCNGASSSRFSAAQRRRGRSRRAHSRANQCALVLMSLGADDKEGQARLAAFLQGLQDLGWIDGRKCGSILAGAPEMASAFANISRTRRAGAGRDPGLRRFSCSASTASDPTVPIVFTQTPDPVGAGFVESLAHPGGNATGFSIWDYSIGGKWLELLKQPRRA